MYCFTVLLIRKLRTVIQRRNTSYNTTLVLQWKIMQHNTGSTVQQWLRTKFQRYTGKSAKMVHLDFIGEGGGRNSHHSGSIKLRLQVGASDEDTGDQNSKPFTTSLPLSSAYYHYFHSLQPYSSCQCTASKPQCHQHSTQK